MHVLVYVTGLGVCMSLSLCSVCVCVHGMRCDGCDVCDVPVHVLHACVCMCALCVLSRLSLLRLV